MLDAGFLPAAQLKVDWGVPLSFGDTLPRLSVAATKPEITLTGFPSGAGATFTVALTDPDAPNPLDPKFAEFCHWLEGDLSLNEAGVLHRPDGGDPLSELVPYFGSAPGKLDDVPVPHAYALVVYLQRATLKGNPAVERYRVAPKSGFPPRRCFNSRRLAADFNLLPIAAFLYRAVWDADQDELAKAVKPDEPPAPPAPVLSEEEELERKIAALAVL